MHGVPFAGLSVVSLPPSGRSRRPRLWAGTLGTCRPDDIKIKAHGPLMCAECHGVGKAAGNKVFSLPSLSSLSTCRDGGLFSVSEIEQSHTASFHEVGGNLLRHLRDGREAFPAMFEAIDHAQHEVPARDVLVWAMIVSALAFEITSSLCALAGVAVFVTYDAIGSLGLFRSFWAPLVRAGGRVVESGPIAPWRRRFRITHALLFRKPPKDSGRGMARSDFAVA